MTARRPEVPFQEPWQARAFAMAVIATDSLGLPWDAFRDRLKAEIAAHAERPYYESWLAALERLLAEEWVRTGGLAEPAHAH